MKNATARNLLCSYNDLSLKLPRHYIKKKTVNPNESFIIQPPRKLIELYYTIQERLNYLDDESEIFN